MNLIYETKLIIIIYYVSLIMPRLYTMFVLLYLIVYTIDSQENTNFVGIYFAMYKYVTKGILFRDDDN